MATYNKSLATDFGGTVRVSQLHKEIMAETGITKTLDGINLKGDVVAISFTQALTAGEQNLLNTVITNHIPTTKTGIKISNISIFTQKVDETVYKSISNFNFPGTTKIKNTTNFKVISFMEEGGTSYDIRIVDMTNNNVIVSKNLTNTEEGITDLGTINSLPANEAIFELQVKVNDSSVAYVKNINMVYDS